MKYFNEENFFKRYERLGRAYFKELNPNRREAILKARKELKRLWTREVLREGSERPVQHQ